MSMDEEQEHVLVELRLGVLLDKAGDHVGASCASSGP